MTGEPDVNADGRTITRAEGTLSWPLDKIGPDLLNLQATVAGNLFEPQQFSGLRLLDIRLPLLDRTVSRRASERAGRAMPRFDAEGL